MAHILIADAQAWAEPTKLQVTTFDAALLAQVESQVLTRLDTAFDISTWLDSTNTPVIVKSIISMFYVSWVYDKQYSEEQRDLNQYAILLRAQAESLMTGLLDGSIVIDDQPNPSDSPVFYPTDASSALAPTLTDMSLGDAKFSMGRVF
jgi:hypothetical protein